MDDIAIHHQLPFTDADTDTHRTEAERLSFRMSSLPACHVGLIGWPVMYVAYVWSGMMTISNNNQVNKNQRRRVVTLSCLSVLSAQAGHDVAYLSFLVAKHRTVPKTVPTVDHYRA